MDCFQIIFDNPKGYYPGETVSGQVVLRTCEAISARWLKICIHGAAHTKWTESEHNHSECSGKHDMAHDTVTYSAEVNYVSGETIVWNAPSDTGKLPAGYHTFSFAFGLPDNCPPSYEGFHGHIRYSVRVELDRPWKFNKKEREDFNVVPNFDLNYLPYGSSPMMMKDVKDIGAVFKKGIVSVTATIPKQAYAPGEYIPITIDIDNTSKRPAYCVRAELHQHSHYHASRNTALFCSHNSYHDHHKDESKRISESRKNIKVAAKSQGREELKIHIPRVPPTFQSEIIQVKYCLSVKIDTETSMNNTLHCEFPLIIGTVPNTAAAIPSKAVIGSSFPANAILFQPETGTSSIPMIPVFPSAPRQATLPPAYFPAAPSAPTENTADPSAPPPSYEESMSVMKL